MNYTVYADGKELELHTTAVFPSPYNKVEHQEFVSLTLDGKVTLTAHSKIKIESVIIRPQSLSLQYTFTEDSVTVMLDKPCNFSVEINGGIKNNLLVFASPVRDYDFSDYSLTVIKRDNGIEGRLLVTQDNTAIYFEDGAVLNGKIELNGCKNILVCGNGYINGENYSEVKDRVRFDILACENVRVQDITILDSLFWNMRVFASKNVDIDNVKLIGCRGNTDGFDICSSQNVHVHNCFTRLWDDSLVVKAFDDRDRSSGHVVFDGSGIDMKKTFASVMNPCSILFEHCVLWNDFARPMELGVSLRADKVSGVTFRDIDVIHSATGYPIMGIHHGDRAEICDVLIEDIRIEDAPGAQLFDIRITDSVWNLDDRHGSIHGISFKNIDMSATSEFPFENSRLEGLDGEHCIRDISFHNISLHGKCAANAEQMMLDIMDHVDGVSITHSEERETVQLVSSSVTVREPFDIADGIYQGTVTVTLTNTSDAPVSGTAGLYISPKNTCGELEKFSYRLAPSESVSHDFRIALPAGKFVLRVLSPNINVQSSWRLVELAWLPDRMRPLGFYNYYGIKKQGVTLSVSDGELTVSTPTLKECDLVLYTAMPVEPQLGEVKFTVEETDFGEATAVVLGKHGDTAAPQLRCPAEIFYVFDNQPKVEKIVITTVARNDMGEAQIPLSRLGVHGNEFLIELEARHARQKEFRYPLTLFHSVVPSQSAHMFAKVIFGR